MKNIYILYIAMFYCVSLFSQNDSLVKKVEDRVNFEVEESIKNSLSKKVPFSINNTIIICPSFWTKIIESNLKEKVTGIEVNFHLPKGNDFERTKGRAIQNENEYKLIWDSFFSKENYTKIRAPNRSEIKSYWSLIPHEISEPIFVLEYENDKFILDFDSEGKFLLFIELIEG